VKHSHQMLYRASTLPMLAAAIMSALPIQPHGPAKQGSRRIRPGLFYLPNGVRECARRRRQLANGQLVGIGAKQ
jgi:hypothetical protein